MTTVTLTPDTTYARVRVIVQSGAGGALLRDGETVRGGESVTGFALIDDYEAPFGVQVTYTLDGESESTTLDVDGAWLSHPTDPTLLTPVIVESDDDWQWSAPGVAHRVIDSEWPVVTHGTRTEHRGSLLLITDLDQTEAMRGLLVSGSPLLLRTPPGCHVDDMWLWPETASRTPMGRGPDPAQARWRLDYQRVAWPGGYVTQDPSNSWSAVLVTHPTWTDLASDHTTWADVLTTAHPHA